MEKLVSRGAQIRKLSFAAAGLLAASTLWGGGGIPDIFGR